LFWTGSQFSYLRIILFWKGNLVLFHFNFFLHRHRTGRCLINNNNYNNDAISSSILLKYKMFITVNSLTTFFQQNRLLSLACVCECVRVLNISFLLSPDSRSASACLRGWGSSGQGRLVHTLTHTHTSFLPLVRVGITSRGKI